MSTPCPRHLDTDIRELLGDRIRTDDEFAQRCWSSLANVDWTNDDGTEDGHSFRSAGRLLAEIRGTGDEPYCYMEFYCRSPYATIDPDFAAALARRGWHGLPLVV